ncbi:hypothetical protein RchiOBHm_Chr2g0151931 [Rosa chinensis]|uniref:Uncharacterized protein n=1 Tax=Rosa chinensis TaxID=74649 RepID=A0A2P6S0A1_ROSCH|nr:hypothetical protein RchiOBHm_Chr2g0151931 [Rosa chinensis]
MSNHEPKAKRSKFIDSWFKRTNVESSSSNVVSKPSISSPNFDVEPQPSIPEPQNNINALERDPELRCAIWKLSRTLCHMNVDPGFCFLFLYRYAFEG